MPEGLENLISPVEVANIIGWLRGPVDQRTLFDDDREFPSVLSEGNGRASIERNDKRSGVSPFTAPSGLDVSNSRRPRPGGIPLFAVCVES
jgi:hypothetical protein